MPRKTIAVFSGTGAQGFSVVSALLEHGKYRIRAVAKSTDNRKALIIRGKGAELMRANLDSIEACKKAVKDAHGVFLVTNFWEHQDEEREYRQGKNVVDACIEEGVQHLVFSGQEYVKKLRGYPCRKFFCLVFYTEIIATLLLFFTTLFLFSNSTLSHTHKFDKLACKCSDCFPENYSNHI